MNIEASTDSAGLEIRYLIPGPVSRSGLKVQRNAKIGFSRNIVKRDTFIRVGTIEQTRGVARRLPQTSAGDGCRVVAYDIFSVEYVSHLNKRTDHPTLANAKSIG